MRYDRALDFSPGCQLYEDSLKSSYLLLVLDKSATGSDDEANLSSVTAQYLAGLQVCLPYMNNNWEPGYSYRN